MKLAIAFASTQQGAALRRQRSIIAVTALSVALGAASEPSAATIFSVTGPESLIATTDSSPVTVMQTFTSASTGETYQGTASSSQGHLGTFITTTGGSTNQGGFASSLASFTTDVIFSPTAGSTATTIDVSLNLNIAVRCPAQLTRSSAGQFSEAEEPVGLVSR